MGSAPGAVIDWKGREIFALRRARGRSGAAARLEHPWNRLCRAGEAFSLIRAHPRSGLTRDMESSLRGLGAARSGIVSG